MKTSEAPTQQQRPLPIPALTGLRLIGAGWVVLFHFQSTLYEAMPFLQVFAPVLGVGDFGVPLFFVLSGYIIWHNYGFASLLTPRSTAKFLWRRFARLWPVNVASQLLAIPVISWGVFTQNYWGAPIPDWFSKVGWLQSAFMVQGFGRPEPVFPWNQPSWTLPAEMVAYVIFPALLVVAIVTGIARRKMVWPWILIALIGAYLVRTDPFAFPYRWIVDLLLFFVVGVALRIGGLPIGRSALAARVTQVAAPLAIVLACYLGGVNFIPSLLAAWVWSLSAASGPGVWLFSLRPAQIAGQASYSLYMLHWVILGYGFIFLFYVPQVRERFLPVFVIAILCVVAVASWISWKFYETPARRLLNRGFERAWRAQQVPTASVRPGDSASSSSSETTSSDEPAMNTDPSRESAKRS